MNRAFYCVMFVWMLSAPFLGAMQGVIYEDGDDKSASMQLFLPISVSPQKSNNALSCCEQGVGCLFCVGAYTCSRNCLDSYDVPLSDNYLLSLIVAFAGYSGGCMAACLINDRKLYVPSIEKKEL